MAVADTMERPPTARFLVWEKKSSGATAIVPIWMPAPKRPSQRLKHIPTKHLAAIREAERVGGRHATQMLCSHPQKQKKPKKHEVGDASSHPNTLHSTAGQTSGVP